MAFSGELPQEIVGIIRAYSKPCLRYPRAYKEVLRMMKLKKWPELMKKISIPKKTIDESKNVLAIVKIFLSERKTYYSAEQAYDNDPTYENNQIRSELWWKDMQNTKNLLIAVYGKYPDVIWSFHYMEDEYFDKPW